MKLIHRRGDDQGIAMITAILVSGIVLTLSITAASLSVHNTNASGLDRKKVQVVAAAEAGVDAAFSLLQTTAPGSLPCTIQASLTTSPSQQYTVTLSYYDGAGNPITCLNPGLAVSPAKALITSTGVSLATGTQPRATRTIQSTVNLIPVFGGLAQAVIAAVGKQHLLE